MSAVHDATPLDPQLQDLHMDEAALAMALQAHNSQSNNCARSSVDVGLLAQHSAGHHPAASPCPDLSLLTHVDTHNPPSQTEHQLRYGSDTDKEMTSKRNAKRVAPKSVGSRKRVKKDVWQTDNLMHDPESPLGHLNLKVVTHTLPVFYAYSDSNIACLCAARSLEPPVC